MYWRFQTIIITNPFATRGFPNLVITQLNKVQDKTLPSFHFNFVPSQNPPLATSYLRISGEYLCNRNQWCKKPECIRAETKFFLSPTFIRDPAWLKGGYGELCAGGSETWHNCPLAHTVWPSPSPTWGADVLLCEMLSPGSHQRWRAPPPCSLPLATFSANSSTSQDMFSHRLDQDYMSTSVGLCTKVVVVFQVPKECNPINFSN